MSKKNAIAAAADLIGNVEPMKATKGKKSASRQPKQQDPAVIDPMERPLWEIDNMFLNPFAPVPENQTWAIMGGRKAIYKQGIITFSAKPKQGKSISIYAILQSLITGNLFGNLTPTDKPQLVIVFDTEMDIPTLTARCRMMQELLGNDFQRFLVVPLVDVPKSQRKSVIEGITEKYRPDIVVIDQVARLIVDFNAAVENNEFGEWLNTFASKRTTFVVIHQNKATGNTQMKGHLGSILEELAVENYTATRENGIFRVTATSERRGCVDDAEPFVFALDHDGRIISSTDIIRQQEEKKREISIAEYREIFGKDESLSSSELNDRIMQKDRCGKRQAYRKMNEALECHSLTKNDVGREAFYAVAKG